MYFLKAETIRALDRETISGGVPGTVLMERAGYGAYRFLTGIASPDAERILIVAGKGNNAGDALVVARYLIQEGRQTELLLVYDPTVFSGDALGNWNRLQEMSPEYRVADTTEAIADYLALWQGDVIIDGLLGTGISGSVSEPIATAINRINAHPARVLALDIPSGLACDSGIPCGRAVHADWTATFAHAKKAMLTPGAAEFCGRVEVIDIGISPHLSRTLKESMEGTEIPACLSANEAAEMLPQRRMQAHKNTFGHVLVVAGSKGMTGAAVLCAQAALRSGAGLVTLAIPESLLPLVAPQMPSIMTLAVPDGGEGIFGPAALPAVLNRLDHIDALALGPGIGQSESTRQFIRAIVPRLRIPAVIDADALNCIADDKDGIAPLRGKAIVITPHPGEFGRLVKKAKPGLETGERLAAATEFARETGITIVLKGFQSIIASAGQDPWINLSGNPGMATAGSGDVLTGIIGGLLGQGVTPLRAAVLGVYLHGLAGDIAAAERGVPGMTSGDISDALGKAAGWIMGNG